MKSGKIKRKFIVPSFVAFMALFMSIISVIEKPMTILAGENGNSGEDYLWTTIGNFYDDLMYQVQYTLDPNGNAIIKEIGAIGFSTGNHTFVFPEVIEGHPVSEISDGVLELPPDAFEVGTSLSRIIIPSCISHIGKRVLQGRKSLYLVYVPASVISIGEKAFTDCERLITVVDQGSYAEQYMRNNNIQYLYTDDIQTYGDFDYIINDDNTISILYYHGTASELEIPETIDGYSVTELKEYSFAGNDTLRKVIIPDSVVKDDLAFVDCSKNLSRNKIGNTYFTVVGDLLDPLQFQASYTLDSDGNATITGLGTIVFSGGNSTLSFPDTINGHPLTAIGSNVLDAAGNWIGEGESRLIIPSGVTSIGSNSFQNRENLRLAYIPSSVTQIGTDAFAGCVKLIAVVDRDSCAEQYVQDNGIRYIYSDELHTSGDYDYYLIDDNYIAILYYHGMDSTVVIPETIDGYTVAKLEAWSFAGDRILSNVIIPASVVTEGGAFSGGNGSIHITWLEADDDGEASKENQIKESDDQKEFMELPKNISPALAEEFLEVMQDMDFYEISLDDHFAFYDLLDRGEPALLVIKESTGGVNILAYDVYADEWGISVSGIDEFYGADILNKIDLISREIQNDNNMNLDIMDYYTARWYLKKIIRSGYDIQLGDPDFLEEQVTEFLHRLTGFMSPDLMDGYNPAIKDDQKQIIRELAMGRYTDDSQDAQFPSFVMLFSHDNNQLHMICTEDNADLRWALENVFNVDPAVYEEFINEIYTDGDLDNLDWYDLEQLKKKGVFYLDGVFYCGYWGWGESGMDLHLTNLKQKGDKIYAEFEFNGYYYSNSEPYKGTAVLELRKEKGETYFSLLSFDPAVPFYYEDKISQVSQMLVDQGYSNGGLLSYDGSVTPQLLEAVNAYQRDHRMKETDYIPSSLLDALEGQTAPATVEYE